MDQRTILFLFRMLIGSGIGFGRFISCGGFVGCCFEAVYVQRHGWFIIKNVNILSFFDGYFLYKFSYFTQKFQLQESIVQCGKGAQKRLNKTHRVNNRFCEGKKGFE